MAEYGVCVNSKCTLSSERPELDRLYVVLDEVDRRIQMEEPTDDLIPLLHPFARYFQTTPVCAACSQPVQRLTRPIDGVIDPKEIARIQLSNEALQASQKLKALGVAGGS